MTEHQEREHDESTVGDEDAGEIDEAGRNLTQQRFDEEGGGSEPADAPWESDELPAGEVDDREADARGSS
jgi:hypothetical protein